MNETTPQFVELHVTELEAIRNLFADKGVNIKHLQFGTTDRTDIQVTHTAGPEYTPDWIFAEIMMKWAIEDTDIVKYTFTVAVRDPFAYPCVTVYTLIVDDYLS